MRMRRCAIIRISHYLVAASLSSSGGILQKVYRSRKNSEEIGENLE